MPGRRGQYRPVSTEEKRAQLKAAGEEWPKYPDGSDAQWSAASDRPAGGRWMTVEVAQKGRKKMRERARMRRADPVAGALIREKERERSADPEYRRRRTLYMADYYHKKKKERYVDAGYTLRNDGQEGSSRRDRTAA